MQLSTQHSALSTQHSALSTLPTPTPRSASDAGTNPHGGSAGHSATHSAAPHGSAGGHAENRTPAHRPASRGSGHLKRETRTAKRETPVPLVRTGPGGDYVVDIDFNSSIDLNALPPSPIETVRSICILLVACILLTLLFTNPLLALELIVAAILTKILL